MTHLIERWGGGVGGNGTPQGNLKDHDQAIFLDPWLSAKGDPLATLVDTIMPLLQPRHRAPRIRSERRDAIRNRHLCVSNIAANLALLALSPNRSPGNLLAVSTAKTKPTRYDREDYPQRSLGPTIDAMEERGLLIRHPYVFKSRTTRVEPTSEFLGMMEHHGVRLQDIGRDAGGETIWLSARADRQEEQGRRPRKVAIPYADTEETIRLRSEMAKVNEVLNNAGIAFDGEPIGPIALRRMFLLRSPADPEAFNLSGRLWGGFWQNLRKDKRHRITIGGEPIADLDYSGMFAALAYLRATGRLPEGDPYDIPGLEEHRDGAKQGLLSLLNYSGPMKRLAPETKALLPEDWTAWMVDGAMTDRHRPIAHLFGKDIGVELMNTESRVLMAVLLELETKGIPALPMHDGINVKVSDREAATGVMRRVSEKMLGAALTVKEKPIWRPEERLKAA